MSLLPAKRTRRLAETRSEQQRPTGDVMPVKRDEEENLEVREEGRRRPDPTMTAMFVPPKRPQAAVATSPVPQEHPAQEAEDTTTATVTGIEKLLVQSPGSSSGPQGTIVVQQGPAA